MPVTVHRPIALAAALDALVAEPDAQILAGGTDLMVEVNHGSRRPPAVVAVGRVAELRGWSVAGGRVRIGAAVTYTEMLAPGFAAVAPALAAAARTVGSPQIRNAGTLGGNVGTASPAGDTLPVLAALDADAEIASAAGTRRVAVLELITGPKRTTLAPGELIVAVSIPVAGADDGQEFLKVGTRNAMVIAVASCAVIVSRAARRVSVALGSVGPVPLRATEAEAWAAQELDWDDLATADVATFGRLVAAAALPIDDHRSTAAYRRHAVRIIAERGLRRCLSLPGAAAA